MSRPAVKRWKGNRWDPLYILTGTLAELHSSIACCNRLIGCFELTQVSRHSIILFEIGISEVDMEQSIQIFWWPYWIKLMERSFIVNQLWSTQGGTGRSGLFGKATYAVIIQFRYTRVRSRYRIYVCPTPALSFVCILQRGFGPNPKNLLSDLFNTFDKTSKCHMTDRKLGKKVFHDHLRTGSRHKYMRQKNTYTTWIMHAHEISLTFSGGKRHVLHFMNICRLRDGTFWGGLIV